MDRKKIFFLIILIILFIFFLIFPKISKNFEVKRVNFQLPSVAYASEKIRSQVEKLKSPGYLVHTVIKQRLFNNEGRLKTEITYDLWQDNGSARFKNLVIYPHKKTVQVNDGFNQYSWDDAEKALYIEHYVNTPKEGLPRRGVQLSLLSDFKKLLGNKINWQIKKGRFQGKVVIVLSFSEGLKNGPNSGANSPIVYYEYYFNKNLRLKGYREWQNKILKREVVVEKYEIKERNKVDLSQFFKFDFPKQRGVKIYEVYRDAKTLRIVSPTPVSYFRNAFLDENYGIKFFYPSRYKIRSSTNGCVWVAKNEQSCKLSLELRARGDQFTPLAYFYLIDGIDNVNISGQISDIKYSKEDGGWIEESPWEKSLIDKYGKTESGLDIFKGTNGGSGGSHDYYIIPAGRYVAIFAVPTAYRMRCDAYKDYDMSKWRDCNEYLKAIAKKYFPGKTIETVEDWDWLPEEFLKDTYKDMEKLIKSFSLL